MPRKKGCEYPRLHLNWPRRDCFAASQSITCSLPSANLRSVAASSFACQAGDSNSASGRLNSSQSVSISFSFSLRGISRKLSTVMPNNLVHMRQTSKIGNYFPAGPQLLRKPGSPRAPLSWVQDKILRFFGRAALLRRPRIQGRAAALPTGKAKKSVLRPLVLNFVFHIFNPSCFVAASAFGLLKFKSGS